MLNYIILTTHSSFQKQKKKSLIFLIIIQYETLLISIYKTFLPLLICCSVVKVLPSNGIPQLIPPKM